MDISFFALNVRSAMNYFIHKNGVNKKKTHRNLKCTLSKRAVQNAVSSREKNENAANRNLSPMNNILLKLQATIECRFTLKRVCDMIITYKERTLLSLMKGYFFNFQREILQQFWIKMSNFDQK